MRYRSSRENQLEFITRLLSNVEMWVTKSATLLRLAIIVSVVLVVGKEAAEFQLRKPDNFHIGKVLITFVFLASLGLLVEIVSHARRIHPVREKPVQLSNNMLQKVETSLSKFAKYFRLAIVVGLVMLVGVETAEFELRISDAFHLGEIIIYFLLLGTLGLLVEVVLQAHKSQQRAMNILKHKHRLSLELLPNQSWESLVGMLTRQLSELVEAGAGYLFLHKPLTKEFEPIAEWVDCDFESSFSVTLDCPNCEGEDRANMMDPHYADLLSGDGGNFEFRSYCYPIYYKDDLYALFRFILKPGGVVSEEQKEILINLTDEIIISLIAGKDRKRLSELEITETALAERHAMSHYLHDNLGQNLGYLRMKLDQFANHPVVPGTEEEFKTEMKRMKDVADESYRFVRNKLEVSIPDSTPLLANYLQEHAKKVAQRANIEINFVSQGASRTIPIELQQAFFFVFQEALANIEKHAKASSANVRINWGEDGLSISVTDDGIGFDVQKVAGNQHFGLEIMRERMTGIGGRVEVSSTMGVGTMIRISAPIVIGKKQEKVIHV